MLSKIPLQIEPSASRNPKVALALFAAATGSLLARHAVKEELGTDYGYDKARELFTVTRDGLRVVMQQKDSPQLSEESADIVFDPWDDGHTRDFAGIRLPLRRSALVGQVPFPAWPSAGTLLLDAAPPERGRRPRVGFCGVAHRPASRREMIDSIEKCGNIKKNIIKRAYFNGREIDQKQAHADFLNVLRDSHYIACPIGAGKFSYRYYETLAAGRVPVVDDLHLCQADDAYHIVAGDNPATHICEAHARWSNWDEITQYNRKVWLDKFSPYGWLETFAVYIRARFGL